MSDTPYTAPPPTTRGFAWVQTLVIAGLLCAAYARTAGSLWQTWTTNDNYSHGPLVPLASLALVWLRWPKLRETEVRRMLDPNHETRQEKIQAALEILGKRVVMAYDDAA